jgi:enamine deaminase RidA (YjgF/YER057c/UK114 family)
VVYRGLTFQAELTGIPEESTKVVPGGAAAELREIFRQLDRTLSKVGIDRANIVSVKLYLQELHRDLDAVNEVYATYFGSHCPNRGVYGVDLQPGILVEASFLATVPEYE